MAQPLVSDELWAVVEPLIPKVERRYRYPGRKRIDDRRVLSGILFVLKTGIGWEHLPQEMGCGSGMTCWRRLHEWQRAGVWQRLHELLLAKLQEAERIDWSRALVDSSHLPALLGLQNRPQPGQQAQERLQAPADHRCGRDPARLPAHRRQPQRLLRTGRARRSDPARARQARPTKTPPRCRGRRPRLPVEGGQQRAAPEAHPTADRKATYRARLGPRPPTLGRRAHPLLAPPTPPPAHPLRTTRRHPRSVHLDRLQPDPPQSAPRHILIDALRPRRRAQRRRGAPAGP
jgi:transposase